MGADIVGRHAFKILLMATLHDSYMKWEAGPKKGWVTADQIKSHSCELTLWEGSNCNITDGNTSWYLVEVNSWYKMWREVATHLHSLAMSLCTCTTISSGQCKPWWYSSASHGYIAWWYCCAIAWGHSQTREMCFVTSLHLLGRRPLEYHWGNHWNITDDTSWCKDLGFCKGW